MPLPTPLTPANPSARPNMHPLIRREFLVVRQFRRNSDMLRRGYAGLGMGFAELDEWTLTAGRLSSYGRNDGWHFYGRYVCIS
jgi:hypothetical protein